MNQPTRIDASSVPSLPRHVTLRFDQVRRRWVVMASEHVYIPDEAAAEILRCCDGRANVGGIVDRLAAKFGRSRDEAARDIVARIQELADKGVVAT